MPGKASRPSAIIEPRSTVLRGRSVAYTLRISRRARQARIEIKSGQALFVIIPARYPRGRVAQFLADRQDWILRHLTSPAPSFSSQPQLRFGDTVPLLGQDVELVRGSETSPSITSDHNRLVVSLKLPAALPRLLIVWYRYQAEQIITARALQLSASLGLQFQRLIIRGQRTRWASCSRLGTLSFNWRLIMAPEPVIDYVIIHELAHLKHMDHSKAFWQLVDTCCPLWREHRKWLRQNQARLELTLETAHSNCS